MPVSRPAPVRIALVDDHDIAALALERMLGDEPDLQFVARYDVPTGLDDHADPIDLALVDVAAARLDADLAALGALAAVGTTIVGWTSAPQPYLERRLRSVGAVSIIDRAGSSRSIVAALRWFGTGADDTTDDARPAADDARPGVLSDARLSPQEQRVLLLVADGRTMKSVAYETGLANSTVEDYVRRIRSKYERVGRPARTRIELLARAVEDGLMLFPPR